MGEFREEARGGMVYGVPPFWTAWGLTCIPIAQVWQALVSHVRVLIGQYEKDRIDGTGRHPSDRRSSARRDFIPKKDISGRFLGKASIRYKVHTIQLYVSQVTSPITLFSPSGSPVKLHDALAIHYTLSLGSKAIAHANISSYDRIAPMARCTIQRPQLYRVCWFQQTWHYEIVDMRTSSDKNVPHHP
jgi:hypothetical protein